MNLSPLVPPLAATLAALFCSFAGGCFRAPGCLPAALAADEAGAKSQSSFGAARKIGKLSDGRIKESSGLCRSLAFPGCFWTHNDGADGRLFLLDRAGETIATLEVEGIKMADVEDIASFAWKGRNLLLLADTGDNDFNRPFCRLVLVEEPAKAPDKKKRAQPIRAFRVLQFQFPDGPRNCEAVGFDPTTQNAYLASKEKRHGVYLYQAPLARLLDEEPPTMPLDQSITEAKLVGSMELPPVAGMDISSDGRRAVLLADDAAFAFERLDHEGWPEAFSRAPARLELPPRKNGESICYGSDGRSLYLTSEGNGEPFWELPATPPQDVRPLPKARPPRNRPN